MKSKDFKIYIKNITAAVKANSRFTTLVLLFLISMIIGSLLVKNVDNSSLKSLISIYSDKRINQSVLSTFFSSLWSALPLFVIVFFLGFYPLGVPAIYLAPIYKGLGTGLTMGYLYNVCGLEGIVYCFILIVPATFIYTMTLIFSCKESISLSKLLFIELTPKAKKTNLFDEVKLYFKRYFVLLLPIILSCIVDLVLTVSFARFFVF